MSIVVRLSWLALIACGPGPALEPVAPNIEFKDETRIPVGEPIQLLASWSTTCGPGRFDWVAANKAPHHEPTHCQFRDFVADVHCKQPCVITLATDRSLSAHDQLVVDSKHGDPDDHSLWFRIEPLANDIDVEVTLRSGHDVDRLSHHFTTFVPEATRQLVE